jgi:ATP-dependent Clp protease ATP-binding subunit ClpC
MFETYTETARKTVFIALYEASEFGSEVIEIEHLLLGLLRADLPLALSLFKSNQKLEDVRARIEREIPHRNQTISASVDLPLSSDSERVLNYAAQVASHLHQGYVSAEHILLAILREKKSTAARVMHENGIRFSQIKEKVDRGPIASAPASRSEEFPDLVAEARNDSATPLIGRERELEQVIQILSRRTKNSVVLVGEAGVGKGSVVRGLAQRIARDDVSPNLQNRQILMVDAWEFARVFRLGESAGPARAFEQKLFDIARYGGPIVYVRGLFNRREDMPGLLSYLREGMLQLIATAAPVSFRLALERNNELARNFELVPVLPPGDEDAIQILIGVKHEFEKFHGVTLPAATIEAAVSASGRFFRDRALPDRAIDLIDDACTLVKLRREREPPEIATARKHLHDIVRQMEQAIVAHDFQTARRLSDDERETRTRITRLRREHQASRHVDEVSGDDIVEAIAARISSTASAVKAALERTNALDGMDEARRELAAGIPPGRRDWLEGLLAYLADCSRQEADKLLEAIRSAKNKLDQDTGMNQSERPL